MSLRKSIKYLVGLTLVFVAAIVSLLVLLAINLQWNVSGKCTYRGSETAERQPVVTYDCSDRSKSAEQWQEDLRIIRKYVVYDGSFACIIFMNALTEYEVEASETKRTEYWNEVHLYSKLLALAAQTAARASNFRQGIDLKAKLWEMQFRLAHYVIEGPLKWTFPQDNRDFELWRRFYTATIRMPATAFRDMCETFEVYRGACTDPEAMPSAYVWEYVNNEPAGDMCSVNLTSN